LLNRKESSKCTTYIFFYGKRISNKEGHKISRQSGPNRFKCVTLAFLFLVISNEKKRNCRYFKVNTKEETKHEKIKEKNGEMCGYNTVKYTMKIVK